MTMWNTNDKTEKHWLEDFIITPMLFISLYYLIWKKHKIIVSIVTVLCLCGVGYAIATYTPPPQPQWNISREIVLKNDNITIENYTLSILSVESNDKHKSLCAIDVNGEEKLLKSGWNGKSGDYYHFDNSNLKIKLIDVVDDDCAILKIALLSVQERERK